MMSAALITPRVWQWLQDGRPARVLHVFEDACNLVNDRQEVVSLVTPRMGPGPFAIVLEGHVQTGLDVDAPVIIDDRGQMLTVGSWDIDVGQAAVWQPKPDWSRLQLAEVGNWSVPIELPSAILSSLELTLTGIITDDVPCCLAGVQGLAGRGHGLTPTGDDVVMGVVYGLWVWHPVQTWIDLIVEAAVPRTTTLSAHFLRVAAAGEATWPWHDLVNGRAGAVSHAQAVIDILAIGQSSGAEAWAGFVYAGQCLGGRE